MADDLIDPSTGESVPAPEVPKVDWPTGKPHISYSELSTWMECAYRHKLLYIDDLGTFGDSPHTSFGKAVHDANENYVLTRSMVKEKAFGQIREAWVKNEELFTKGPFPDWSSDGFGEAEDWVKIADRILDDVPAFLDKEFPGWEPFAAEDLLYEPIDGHPLRFKGYIDAILKVPDKKGKKFIYWLIDWKTCGWGWGKDKQRDFRIQLQLILYKHFFAKKHGIDPKDIRCAFVLLKRDAKPGKSLGIVPVSVGPTTDAKGLKVINNHVSAVKRGLFLKNRSSCRFCEFDGTPHCPSIL